MAIITKMIRIPPPYPGLIRVDRISRVGVFDNGVGVFDERERMIAWIETYTPEQSEKVCDLLQEIINNPRRAQQPDFSFIVKPQDAANTTTVTSARAPAVQPTRQTGASASSASTGS